MSDETKLQKATHRGMRAKALLENEILNEAFKILEDSYIQFWRVTKPEDERGREKAYIAINVLGKVQQHLQSVIANGTLAQAELNKLHADAERKKKFGIL